MSQDKVEKLNGFTFRETNTIHPTNSTCCYPQTV